MALVAESRLRVLMVTTSFPVQNNPASGIFVKRLADALSDRVNLAVLMPASTEPCHLNTPYPLFCFRYAPHRWQLLAHRPGGIPVALKTTPILWLLLPGFLLAMFFQVIRLGMRVDVIHANWSVPGVMAGLAGWFIRKPVITTIRGSDVSSLEKSFIKRRILGVLLRLNKRVLTVSETIQKDLVVLAPRHASRIKVIPNGVEDSLLRIERESHPSFQLLTVGNLIPGKDIATIIKALSRQATPVSLRVVGEGEEYRNLKQLVQELGVESQVNFVGVVPPSAIAGELKNADVFILASRSEGRPNVVVEAMAAGCPVISSSLPGVQELIEHEKQGLLFESGDISTLAEHIRRLATSPELRLELARHARQKVIDKKITWSNCAEGYLDEYLAMSKCSREAI
ncbi:MAG: glycosyltransferase family 4 protein [Gammaproteobacteria bacterium]